MKKKFLPFLAVLAMAIVIAGGTLCVSADTQIGNANLIVTGMATLEAKADLCTFSGSIRTVADDMNTAESKCEEIAAKVRDVFSEYGTVSECHSEVSPMYGQNGYSACKYFCFETEKTDSLPQIREKLAQAGLNCIEGTAYSCKDDSEYRIQALQQAIADAKEKAAALGAVGELVKVEETCCYPSCYGHNGKITENRVIFTASVRAVFRIKKTAEND